MANVIIFGIQDFAELAHYYLENDSEHHVIAFAVNECYLPDNKMFKGLPVVAFENIEKKYSPKEFKFFAPMAPQKMNTLRENIYNNIKSKGYDLISYISTKATVFNGSIGDNCFILENNTIQPFTTIGNNVVLWSGNHIGHHSLIKDHVTFTSHVVLSGHCIVESYCTFGVNSTIRDGLHIAEGTFVGMSATIIKNTESWSIYKGNPAQKSEISSKKI
ncbi:acetyltransferase [Flavobacterium johnsoniae]|uniref:Acyl-(Acyl carrier protein)-like protein n=1 Tax=Flavobacterium johnsoniae (strain ATCC 17061 / DSM 2064 / JCM 8514 / BCRC 14874 / CCUG 350202 / NBRC 14942 / NCIMB 11054 / UW101) TaxID=376686 RepID=A5FN71_FLAJ1|nr:acetyltransferase [Flavobacterium johnsoniae]ABQ03356.1 Acyl-(acyl carrier protein)-like protein [Flavobacterium johnsoniae UW101]OXG01228.1 sugar O-acyltransferase [Flavobacterium johnsoniae UW101]WQG79779.1 acetyltransferase [Flavobacterium johnsoniae UW101]SHL77608.1 sugar O-acyltransferase, sialic acid O-acetyltransferase NeuD family [Flavobacterium johnsoniae]